MKAEPPPPVKSATRAIDVLELLSRADGPVSFATIGKSLAIPNSSLFYLLNTLIQRGYLLQHEDGGYSVGPAVGRLAGAMGASSSWLKAVEPLVEQVWNTLRETTHYVERRGDSVECLIIKLSSHHLLPVLHVGQRAPMHTFSGGKIVLAHMDDDALNQYLKSTPMPKLTPHTLTTPESIRRDIASVRAEGIALSREEHGIGIIGISVGLKTTTTLVGALGIVVPVVRCDQPAFVKITTALQAAAKQFTADAAALSATAATSSSMR